MESISEPDFWKGIIILLKNYHAINKKVFSSKFSIVRKVAKGIISINESLTKNLNLSYYEKNKDFELKPSTENEMLDSITKKEYFNKNNEGFIFWMDFLTKKGDGKVVNAICLIDFASKSYHCIFHSHFINFSIYLVEEKINIIPLVEQNPMENGRASNWCEYVLTPKLLKWIVNSDEQDKNKLVMNSLQLINSEKYIELYNVFKNKYSNPLMKIWPESTDPLKFIYEDLAIAAYLVCLWTETKSEPSAFADLGCGNGLLVYVLSEEGYNGYGYDIRKRKIWGLYPKTTILIEESINPNTFQLPNDVDWIIGNHSDELSPWIPAISMLTSYEIKYFLLPCCPFEFSGVKYQRRNSKISAYNDFIEYVNMISQRCGFKTMTDRLKIPSTKRIALVGIYRNYERIKHEEKAKSIRKFIDNQIKGNKIKIREKEEIVRNCTQLDKTIIDKIVLKLFNCLLNSNVQSAHTEDYFDMGKKLTIKELVNLLTSEDLKNIKSECGGLKTLLKNHHAIFKLNRDEVQLRRPLPKDSNLKKPMTFKKRSCFFKMHHPNGCPLSDEDCTFIH